ncbi:hypothetical protein BvCmsOUP088_01315 [Escherichia coli]|nr:hypothetical protein BvCmsOUP088_01315 [Escherichia coli]GDS84418.1 hypothetical protein BvCmsOUP038_04766 [Escherichia coli]
MDQPDLYRLSPLPHPAILAALSLRQVPSDLPGPEAPAPLWGQCHLLVPEVLRDLPALLFRLWLRFHLAGPQDQQAPEYPPLLAVPRVRFHPVAPVPPVGLPHHAHPLAHARRYRLLAREYPVARCLPYPPSVPAHSLPVSSLPLHSPLTLPHVSGFPRPPLPALQGLSGNTVRPPGPSEIYSAFPVQTPPSPECHPHMTARTLPCSASPGTTPAQHPYCNCRFPPTDHTPPW